MSSNLNLKLPPIKELFNPSLPSPPNGVNPPSNFKPPGGIPPLRWFKLGTLGGLAWWVIDELLFPPPANQGEDEFLQKYHPRKLIDVAFEIPAPYYGGGVSGSQYKMHIRFRQPNGTYEDYYSGTTYTGKCTWGTPYTTTYFGTHSTSGLGYWTWVLPFTYNNGIASSVSWVAYNEARPMGWVKQDVGVDVNPPPTMPGVQEQGTPNPVPGVKDNPPYTDEEFYNKYGYPPRLKPTIEPPSKIEEERKLAPLDFPEYFPDSAPDVSPSPAPLTDPAKDVAKPGNSPAPLPAAPSDTPTPWTKITNFKKIDDKDKIIFVEPYIKPTKPAAPDSPPSPVAPDPDFEEDIKRYLDRIDTQTKSEQQKTNTETAICKSIQEGCMKPLKDKLDELLEDEDSEPCELETEEIEVVVGSCNPSEEPAWTEETLTLEVPVVLSATISNMFAQQLKTGKVLCELDASPPVPQEYEAKRAFFPPQIVVVFRRLGENSKGYNKISVPWVASATPTSTALIPNYTKGQFYGIIYYKDNSRFTIYSNTEQEARDIVDYVLERIDLTKVDDPPRLSFGERKGYPMRVEEMKAIKQYYFPDGQQQTRAAWMRYIIAEE